MTHELVSHITDVLVRGLSPERTLNLLQQRVNGANSDELLVAALTLLRDQKQYIAELEANVDSLEANLADLHVDALTRKSIT